MSWTSVKIGDFCLVTDYVANGSFESLRNNVEYIQGDGYAVLVRLTDFTKKWSGEFKFVSQAAYEFLRHSKLFPNDLVMSNVGEPGKVFIVPDLGKPMTLGPNSILIRPSPDKASTSFLHYYFQSPVGQDKISKITSGTTQKKFNKTSFRGLSLNLPPLATQQKIVAKLDAIFAEIDKATAAAEANAKNAQVLFQSFLSEVLNENRQKNKEFILDDVCELITCGVAKRPEYVGSGIPFLSAKNVKKQKIIWSDYQFISGATHSELTKHNKPLKGDILYTRVGSYGEAAIIDKDCEFSIFVSLTLIKPKTEMITNKFLVYFLNSAHTKALASRSISGSGVGNLNVGTVRKFIINLPSISDQGEIVEKLDSMKTHCDSLSESYIRKYQSLCSYKESVLKQAFSGELIKE